MEKEKLPKMSVSSMRVVGPGKTRDLSQWEIQKPIAPAPERKKEPNEQAAPTPQFIGNMSTPRPSFSLPKVTMFRVQGEANSRPTRLEKYFKRRLLNIRHVDEQNPDIVSDFKTDKAPLNPFDSLAGNVNFTSDEKEQKSKPIREGTINWRAARDRMAYAASSFRSGNRSESRERKGAKSEREYRTQEKQITWGERVLRNCAVVAAVVLCVLALKNIDSPVTQWATDSIKGLVTAEVKIDEQLGKLQFVQEWMPEAMQVFLSTGESVWAWPISGKLGHVYTPEEPWVEIISQKQTVHAATDGEVLSVAQDQRGDYVIRIRHLNGYETVYANLNGVSVQEGDSIAAGSAIGIARQEEVSETMVTDIGDENTAIECRLYLEVRKDGIPTNPMQVFPAARRE